MSHLAYAETKFFSEWDTHLSRTKGFKCVTMPCTCECYRIFHMLQLHTKLSQTHYNSISSISTFSLSEGLSWFCRGHWAGFCGQWSAEHYHLQELCRTVWVNTLLSGYLSLYLGPTKRPTCFKILTNKIRKECFLTVWGKAKSPFWWYLKLELSFKAVACTILLTDLSRPTLPTVRTKKLIDAFVKFWYPVKCSDLSPPKFYSPRHSYNPHCHGRLLRLLDRRYVGIAKGVGQSAIVGRIHVAPLKVSVLVALSLVSSVDFCMRCSCPCPVLATKRL